MVENQERAMAHEERSIAIQREAVERPRRALGWVFVLLAMALALAAMVSIAFRPHAAWPSALGAQCSPDDGAARPFGPPSTAADSGRMYSYLVSPDGRELYFCRRVGSAPEDYRIFRSLRVGSGWSSAEQVALGGEFSDLFPSLSSDGLRLVFSSYRPVPGDTSRVPNAHIWMARRGGTGWGAPEFVRASRLGHYHSGLRQDGAGTLRFRVTSPDWREAHDAELRWSGNAFEATITNTASPVVEYWRRRVGDSLYVWGAVTGSAGLSLLSVSRVTHPGGRRAPAQYFVTRAHEGGWTPLVRAGGGLGEGAPNFLWFSPDGCYVHYTRDYSEFMRVPVRSIVLP